MPDSTPIVLFRWRPSSEAALGLAAGTFMGFLALVVRLLGDSSWLGVAFTDIGMVLLAGTVLPLWYLLDTDRSFAEFGLTPRRWIVSVAIDLVLGVAALLWLLPRAQLAGFVFDARTAPTVAYVLLLGVFECFFFYGFLRTLFERAFGTAVAVVLAAVFYAVYRGGPGLGYLLPFVFGLACAVAFRAARNVLAVYPFFWGAGTLYGVFVLAGGSEPIHHAGMRATYLGALLAIAFIWAGMTRTSSVRRPWLFSRRPRAGRVVALTFDDGPDPSTTPKILEILDDVDTKATFFMIGEMAREHPEVAHAVAEAGMLIGNHTESHPYLGSMDDEDVRVELEKAQASIEQATGVRPRWFRSPENVVNPSIRRIAEQLGMRSARWNIDTSDWETPEPSIISSHVVRNVFPGSIVIMHDGGGDRSPTIEALPVIIEEIKARGFRLVTLDEI